MDAPKILIAGKPTPLPPISFAAVKLAAPFLDDMALPGNEKKSLDDMVAVVGVFLGIEPATFETQLLYNEVPALVAQWREIMDWAGLVPATDTSGEAPATSSPPSASTT